VISDVQFIPFPSAQPKSSTWTTTHNARSAGSYEERHVKRKGGDRKQLRQAMETTKAQNLLLEEKCKDLTDRLKLSRHTVASLREDLAAKDAELLRVTETDTESNNTEEMSKFSEVAQYAQELEERLAVLERENETLEKRNKKYKYMLQR